ncbi:MAG: aldo/keto reductase [Myxococcales bacterium]|nr:aldo/keto reductase [Myxococcales bacterium]
MPELASLGPVSSLGLGAGPLGDERLDDAEALRLVHAALDHGLTLIDTAPSYGASERRLGHALADRRARVLVSTKVGYGIPGEPDWTGPCIARGIERACTLFGGYLDLVHLHSCGPDVLARDDVHEALHRARDAGQVRVLAYSGDGEGLRAACAHSHFEVLQTSFNLVDQEAHAHVGNRGWLGKRTLMNAAFTREGEVSADVAEYRRRFREASWPDEVVADPVDVALRFAAFEGPHVALVGTSRRENLERLVAAWSRGPLDESLVARLREVAAGHEWPGMI